MFEKIIMGIKVAVFLIILCFGLNVFSQGCGGDDCDQCDICGYSGFHCPICSEYIDCLMMCPLIIDLDGDGFRFSGPEGAVEFDMFLTGPERAQWVVPNQDDAFLAMDLNGNGIVDDGSEMFGNGTLIHADGTRAINGFVGLAQYDLKANGGNDDGFITEADQIWKHLYLWLDNDANGISEPYEMAPIGDFFIDRFTIIPREKYTFDKHGNWLRYYGSAQFKDAKSGKSETSLAPNGRLLDIYFLKVKDHTEDHDHSRTRVPREPRVEEIK